MTMIGPWSVNKSYHRNMKKKHIRVPANEEVHVWCETFDVAKGDSLRVGI